MPKKMEMALRREAKKKGLTGDRADRYTWGTMMKTNWRPKKHKTVLTGKK
jgi:hypothetical protein